MPDADGNIKGIAVPAEAWERVFGADSDVVAVRARPIEDLEHLAEWATRCCGCGGCDKPADRQAAREHS